MLQTVVSFLYIQNNLKTVPFRYRDRNGNILSSSFWGWYRIDIDLLKVIEKLRRLVLDHPVYKLKGLQQNEITLALRD